jgi:hypothetical protein
MNMVLRKPTATDKLAYFTRRALGDKGKVMLWRFADEDLTNVEYTCQHCGKPGEKQVTFERTKISIKKPNGKRKSVQAFILKCDSCSQDMVLEQWVKKGKGKKKAE